MNRFRLALVQVAAAQLEHEQVEPGPPDGLARIKHTRIAPNTYRQKT